MPRPPLSCGLTRRTIRSAGQDPYSASKAATEIVVEAYRRSFFDPERLGEHGVRLASARAGNVIGGGDWSADRIVPDMVRALSAGEPVPVRNPDAVRPWQHVLEPLSGYLALAARMASSGDQVWCSGWNFGPAIAQDLTVRDVVGTFLGAWGCGTWSDVSGPDQLHEAPALRLSVNKARTILGWEPRWTLEEAIRQTADWYLRFYDGRESGPMRETCLDQIPPI